MDDADLVDLTDVTGFGLGRAERALAEEVAAFAASVEHLAVEADAISVIHPGMRAALRESSLSRLMVPAEYGGRFDRVDPLAVCLAREQLMKVSCQLDSLFALQGIGSYAITVGGTDAQRAHWLPRVAGMEAIAALALTEEHVGSDLKGITTSVTDKGDRLVINGSKSFISNAGAADFYVTLVKEERDGAPALSLVLIPSDTPGVAAHPGAEVIAPHVLGELTFDGVELPPEARLGTPGNGMHLVLSTLAVFRVSVAGAAVGLSTGALHEAARHARTREAFGRPLLKHGPIAQLLADSWNELEMARLLTYSAAHAARGDARASLNRSSMAKVASTEAAGRIVDRCVQVMGRFGLITGSRMERYYRQARPMRLYEGASEVVKLGIAATLCDTLP